MNKRLTACCGFVVALSFISIVGGCSRGPKIKDPDPAVLEAFLVGKTIQVGTSEVAVREGDTSSFRVEQIFPGPEGKSASAVVSFSLIAQQGTYNVKGVISYDRSTAEPFRPGVFEATEVSPSEP